MTLNASLIFPFSIATVLLATACTRGEGSSGQGSGGQSSTGVTSTSGYGSGSTATAGYGGALAFACSGAKVSYATDVAPILQGCGNDTCHSGGEDPLILHLQTPAKIYESIVIGGTSLSPLAIPGKPDDSSLLDRVLNRNLPQGNCPMPYPTFSYTPPQGNMSCGDRWAHLPDSDIQNIYDWICAGAKND